MATRIATTAAVIGFILGTLYAVSNGWSGETTAFLAFGCAIGLGVTAAVVSALFGVEE